MTKTDIELIAEKYELREVCAIYNDGEPAKYLFIDPFGVNVLLVPDTKAFSFEWGIPRTTFSIKSGECTPYTNDTHFSKMYARFRAVVLHY